VSQPIPDRQPAPSPTGTAAGVGWLVTLLGVAGVATAGLFPVAVAVVLGLVGVAAGIALLVAARTQQGYRSGHGVVGFVLATVGLLLSSGLALVSAALPTAAITPTGPVIDDQTPASSSAPVGPLRPAAISASSTASPSVDGGGNAVSFDAVNLADGDATTAWRTRGDGVGQTITVSFGRPVHVTEVGMIVGYAKVDPYDDTDRFTQNGRVTGARFAFDDGRYTDVRFADSRGLQKVTLEIDTASVRVTVLSSVPGERGYTAMSELEFSGSAG
jgi:hypothetical protein